MGASPSYEPRKITPLIFHADDHQHKPIPRRQRKGNPEKSLFRLPNELILGSITKMGNVAVCRMRRTCSFMNSFIETHKLKIASRPYYGYRMGLKYTYNRHFYRSKSDYEVCFVFVDEAEKEKKVAFAVREDFNERLSAIAIRSLTINGQYSVLNRLFWTVSSLSIDALAIEELKGTVRNFEHKAFHLRFFEFPCESTTALTDSIEYSKLISINLPSLNEDDFGKQLTVLETAKNASQFWVHIRDRQITSGLYRKTQKFYGFSISNFDHFYGFIWDLYSSTSGSLQLVVFTHGSVDFDKLPHYETLWKIQEIPKSRLPRMKMPATILRIELKSEEKCALVVVYEAPNIIGIFVVRNSKKEIFDCLIKNLGITRVDPRIRNQILDRQEFPPALIRQIYLENRTFTAPIDYLINPESYY